MHRHPGPSQIMCIAMLVALLAPSTADAQVIPAGAGLRIEAPSLTLTSVPTTVTVTLVDSLGVRMTGISGRVVVTAIVGTDSSRVDARLEDGRTIVKDLRFHRTGSGRVMAGLWDFQEVSPIRVVPGWLSLVPPLLAIALALIFKQVLISLFAGIWIGAIFIYDYNPIVGLMRALDTYVVGALADVNHATIVLFTLTLGGMVGILAKSGGAHGIVDLLRKKARDYRQGQIASWGMSLLMFFDDYSNVLLVGNTMRPLTDRLRISREKLSYLVDASAAPVVSLFFISTWIGYEVGLLDAAIQAAGLTDNAYLVFLKSTPFRFYSIFSIVFVFFIAWTGRDFGPMRAAEARARATGEVLREGSTPLFDRELTEMMDADVENPRWYNGLVPIGVVILCVLVGLLVDGRARLEAGTPATFFNLLQAADSYPVLMWASFAGAVTAAAMVISQKILSLTQTLEAWIHGVKSMIVAMTILVAAWGIGQITVDMKTADYVIFGTEGILSPHLIPMLTFLIAAFTGFSTGSSWGTMAILYPLVVPLSLAAGADLDPGMAQAVFLGTVASVLSGSVFGDHCSPISDTTIMSSMSAGCDHVDHVKTQIPYAVTVMLVSAAVGYLPTGFGVPFWVTIPIGLVMVVLPVYIFGRRSLTPEESAALPTTAAGV